MLTRWRRVTNSETKVKWPPSVRSISFGIFISKNAVEYNIYSYSYDISDQRERKINKIK